MKKEFIITLVVLFSITIISLVLVGCTKPQESVCNKPYIHVGTECCLDTDDNQICDSDETIDDAVNEIEEVKLPDVIPAESEETTAEETPEKTTSGKYGDFVNVGGVSVSESSVSSKCGDGICANYEDCKTCPLDCGCGDNSICLVTKQQTNSCQKTVSSSENIEIWLSDDLKNQLRGIVTANAGDSVNIKFYTKNKARDQYSCTYWIMKDGITQKKKDFSLSSFQTWFTTFQEVEQTFIANGKEKEIDLRFAATCIGNQNKVNETMYTDLKVVFIPK